MVGVGDIVCETLLVHVSELSWKHIDHPSEVVRVGDEVTVEVLDVDMDRERVSLSLKATQEDPTAKRVAAPTTCRCRDAHSRRPAGPSTASSASRNPRDWRVGRRA